jgi:beta-phosphoglucomutase family hydrolase
MPSPSPAWSRATALLSNLFGVQQPVADFDWRQHAGVLFDLDGVITPTAEIHEHAWGELFADFDYTEADYLRYIDGKPRYDGVRSFLASRDITLPEGHPDDPPGDDTVCAMGNRKNQLFNTILERDGIEPYPSSVATLDLLDAAGVKSAIVSSSKNARNVLDAAGLGDRFDVVVDGVVAASEHIVGKPAPDMFLHAARRLGVEPEHTVVVEDAVSGVAAGAAGGFAVVIGVDRGAGVETLLDQGADFVVDDLSVLLDEDGRPGRLDP